VFGTPVAVTSTVESPSTGSYTVRVTITDAFSQTDTADVTIAAVNTGGGGSTSPPATPVVAPASSGGGGNLGAISLLLLAAIAAAACLTRRHRES
jgi:hypothetical protein